MSFPDFIKDIGQVYPSRNASIISYLNVWKDSPVKLSSSRFLFIGRFLIIDLLSSLLFVCSYFIIISWFSLDKLYVSSNLSISSSYQICWCISVQKGNKRTGRGTRGQIVNIHWIIEKAREFQKNIYFCFIATPKPVTVWITTNCGKFFKRWEYQTTWPASWKICMQVRKQQLDLDMELPGCK